MITKETISQFHKPACERVHASLYGIDRHILKARKLLATGLEALHRVERESVDVRTEARVRIKRLEELRDRLEQIGWDSGKILSDLIHDDGCDTSCQSAIRD